jgi:uncharacterized protein (UPF0333 family)
MLSKLKEISIEVYLLLFILFISIAGTHTIICMINDNTYTIQMATKDKIIINNRLSELESRFSHLHEN